MRTGHNLKISHGEGFGRREHRIVILKGDDMRLVDLQRFPRDPKRPKRWHHWPIRIGWVPRSAHALVTWHAWPIDGSNYYPDATAVDLGWTLHIGALKVCFGKVYDPGGE